MNRLKFQVKKKFPSQLEVNPKNISARTLRSEKKIEGSQFVTPKDRIKSGSKRRLTRKA